MAGTIEVVGVSEGTVTEDLVGISTGDLDLAFVADGTETDGSETWSVTAQGEFGSASIDENGEWTYTLHNENTVVDDLDAGQSLTDTFTVTANISGQALTQEVVVNVQGTTDPCYSKGTKILTDRGWVRIEMLRVGDLLETQDDGLVAIDWIGDFHSRIRQNHRPVVIPKDCFGKDCPNRDLIVSPQHLMLLGNFKNKVPKYFQEVFVPAQFFVEDDVKDLYDLNKRPYFYDGPATSVHYYHLLLANHHVIFANQTASESLNLGPIALEAFQNSSNKCAKMLDHDQSQRGRMICARPILKKTEFLALGRALMVHS